MDASMTFADIVVLERDAVAAGAAGCGKSCDEGCHGPLTCFRKAHAHDDGGLAPHAGYDADGQLIQWTCVPGDHDGLTDDTRAAARAEARRVQTRDLLSTIDPQDLAAALREAGVL